MFKNNSILVCVTAQDSCIDIINKGKEFAEKYNAVVEIVTIQPKKTDAEKRAEDMKCLQSLSKLTECPITIIYSDNVLHSLASYISKVSPKHIFTGQQGIESEFVMQLSMMCDAPISMISKDATVFTLTNS